MQSDEVSDSPACCAWLKAHSLDVAMVRLSLRAAVHVTEGIIFVRGRYDVMCDIRQASLGSPR